MQERIQLALILLLFALAGSLEDTSFRSGAESVRPAPDAILGCRFARRGMQLFLRRDLSLRRLDRGSRSSFGP